MSTSNPQEETVGWIAIESINKTLDDNTTIEAVRTDDIFDEQTKTINFSKLHSTPRLFTKIATMGAAMLLTRVLISITSMPTNLNSSSKRRQLKTLSKTTPPKEFSTSRLKTTII